MTAVYHPASTGLLLIDPYNDFLAEGGKLWPAVEKVAVATNTVENMKAVTAAARAAGARSSTASSPGAMPWRRRLRRRSPPTFL